MVPFPLPSGRFSYGPRAAVAVDVVHVDAGDSGLAPVVNPIGWVMGDDFVISLNPAQLLRTAEVLGVDPVLLAHWLIAFESARIAIGYADPRMNTVLVDADSVQRAVSDPGLAKSWRRMAHILALEIAGSLLLRHPGLQRNREAEEVVRHHYLRQMGISVEPLTPGRHARVLGRQGEAVTKLLTTRVLPWLRENIAA